jgi:cysteine-rich repeat protein
VFPPAPNGTLCEDGQYCTVNDTCQAGACSGPPRDCNDQNSCTTDSCDENVDQCVNTQAQSCCGDGTQNPGEECDDGNTSNQDGCLNTCVLPTCGDGFVRTGVEQCDAGGQNSNAPDAPCRLDCTPRRCGDGVVDAQSGEQCDDGGTTAGDGCSASCVAEPPATAALIPGRGIASSDCALEWAYDRPALDRRGVPWIKQTCRDGDPLCDMGTTPGECTFFVWSCANNTDPRLPTCVAGAPGVGNVSTVEARKPSLREAGLRPVDAANRLELLRAAAASQTSALGACGPRMTIRVPLKAPGKKGVKVLKLVGTTDKNLRDTDVLKLFCTP